MRKLIILSILLGGVFFADVQAQLSPLTVEKIMRDPVWIGTSPADVEWDDTNTLYFKWNPDKNKGDSLYSITITNKVPQKVTAEKSGDIVYSRRLAYNNKRNAYTYTKSGDIFFSDISKKKTIQVTQTSEYEANPVFSFDDSCIVYARNQNLYAWNIFSGNTIQLTNIQKGNEPPKDPKQKLNTQEEWLKKDQLQWMEILKERKAHKDMTDAYNKSLPEPDKLRTIYTGDKSASSLQMSPDGRFITYRLNRSANGAKNTIIPNYVTESGFTEDINGRTKVGAPLGSSEFFVYDRYNDTIIAVKTDAIPGIKDIPGFINDYPKLLEEKQKKAALREVTFASISWSPKGSFAVVDIRAQDNKDRWLMKLEPATGKLVLLDRQHDDAWIGGPGVWGNNTGWVAENIFWFQSEVTGYSHLYTIDLASGKRIALTSGNYEVQACELSNEKKYFYITTNEIHPGEKQFYRLPVTGGRAERITTMTGANLITISPDEKTIAILYSYSNKPTELLLQENKPGGKLTQITFKAQSEEFKTYNWRDPELITFKARDGAEVYARLYKPANPAPSKPAVIFVHGAGYLQNAHKWWSSYFREYMFHNLLADNGYYVLDMDYRASAGYGRDWRTGIYRFMGGKDLTDNIDGAKWLTEKFGVDPKHIGIYGGSYGGFITLMALFTSPGTFAAGAALRPVTDWAHYNHGYTSNILNTPAEDSIAYRKSSPIYFAEGLQDNLLICHGVVDVNVHFQDVVRLNQRLIELGKKDWQVAMYPVEDHGFVEPSSWADEYKRIFKLFEEVLKK
ncbi:MAG: S9 family peptidase [Terrimonas sp.]|nr:S9 family peptidase [Terrimonas sp.]OJY82043.1 MAG: S9 family peptidase [Sphingobacteriales bacterium 40-81]